MFRMSSHRRIRAPHWAVFAATGLIAGTAFATPGLATQTEISALTPGIVAGFNDETVQEFIRQNPEEGELRFTLSPEDRQQIVTLGLAAAAFRDVIVKNGFAGGDALTDKDTAVLSKALDLGPAGPPPALWRSFFEGSVLALGDALAPVKRVGFYNPVVDGWVMTDWAMKDDQLSLTVAHAVTGAVLRGEPEGEGQMPEWTRVTDVSVVGALAQSHKKAVETFRSIHPVASRQPPPAPQFDVHAQRRTIEVRLGALRRSLNVLGRPALMAATRQFLDALYSGSPMRLAGLIKGGSTASVHWVNGLLTPLRDRFQPTGVMRQADALTVMFGVPENGRWVLMARYGGAADGGAPELDSVSFIDLVTAEKARAEP